jgi:hypothetical protein
MRGRAAPGGRLPGLCRGGHSTRPTRSSRQEDRSRPEKSRSGSGLVPARAPGHAATGGLAARSLAAPDAHTRAASSGCGAAGDAPADAHAHAARAHPRRRPEPGWPDASAGVARTGAAQQRDLALRRTGSSSARAAFAGRGSAPAGPFGSSAAGRNARPPEDGDRQWLRLDGTRRHRRSARSPAPVLPVASGRATQCGNDPAQSAADGAPVVAEPHPPVRQPHAGHGNAHLRAAAVSRGSPRSAATGRATRHRSRAVSGDPCARGRRTAAGAARGENSSVRPSARFRAHRPAVPAARGCPANAGGSLSGLRAPCGGETLGISSGSNGPTERPGSVVTSGVSDSDHAGSACRGTETADGPTEALRAGGAGTTGRGDSTPRARGAEAGHRCAGPTHRTAQAGRSGAGGPARRGHPTLCARGAEAGHRCAHVARRAAGTSPACSGRRCRGGSRAVTRSQARPRLP